MDLWIVMIPILSAMDQVNDQTLLKRKMFLWLIIDDNGRYSYKQQPSMCKWNCGKLAEALGPLLPIQRSRTILDKFEAEYDRVYLNKMRQKVMSSPIPNILSPHSRSSF